MSSYPGPAFMFREDYHNLAKVVQSASASITTCFLFTRLWARANKYKGLWWDDYILIAAWACLMVGNGCSGAAPAYGFNIVSGSSRGATLHFTSISFCYLATAWSKTAFGTTLFRLTAGWLRTILWFVMIIVNASGLAMVVSNWIKICDTHMESYTDFGSQCIDINLVIWLHMGYGIISLLADVVLAVYPWAIVRQVQMSKKEKRAIASTMSLVGLSAVMAIIRVSLQSLVPRAEWGEFDWTYGAVCMMCFMQAEAAVMIIAQTLPVLRVWYQSSSKPNSTRISLHQGSKTAPENPAGGAHATTLATIGSGIELVQLPGGRIVTAEEANRLQADGQATARPTQPAAGEFSQEYEPAARRESDEVHRTWIELGLSRRAWSQSPPSSPPRGHPM